MSPVHKLSQIGSISSNKVDYPSMLAGYGDFGAMQRIGYQAPTGVTSVTFSSIPQTFQDLFVVGFVRSTQAATSDNHYFRINGDTATLYSRTLLEGDGSSAYSQRDTTVAQTYIGAIPAASATSGLFDSFTLHLLNYTSTTTFKSGLTRFANDRNGSGYTNLVAHCYRSTAAITSLTLFNGSSNFASGSTFALYGIKASAA